MPRFSVFALLGALLLAGRASAAPITIDPNGFEIANWRLLSQPSGLAVAQLPIGGGTYDLADGPYRIDLGSLGPIDFSVAAGTAGSSDARVSAAAGRITFTALRTVALDPAGFEINSYRVLDHPATAQIATRTGGSTTFALLDGSYELELGHSLAPIAFAVGAGGVSSADPRLAASGFQLTFAELRSVAVNPNGFEINTYRVLDNPVSVQVAVFPGGQATARLFDGSYELEIGRSLAPISFAVGAGGVSTTDPRVTAAGSTLTFSALRPVAIDTNGLGITGYRVLDAPATVQIAARGAGPATVLLLDGNYEVELATLPPVPFTVSASGVTAGNPRATASGTKLTLCVCPVSIRTSATTQYGIVDAAVTTFMSPALSGESTAALVAGGFALIALSGPASVSSRFTVGQFNDGVPACAMSATDRNLTSATVTMNGASFALSTGAPRCGVNLPPVAVAGAPQVIECTGALTSAVLDGSASHDPEGDALSYSWTEGTQALATSTLPQVSVGFALGVHAVTLQVTDAPGGSSKDTTTVTVRDTTPPALACSLSPVRHHRVTIAGTLTDVGGLASAPLVLEVRRVSPAKAAPARSLTVGADGTFAETLRLPGNHAYLLTLIGTDKSGNSSTCTRRVSPGEDDDQE